MKKLLAILLALCLGGASFFSFARDFPGGKPVRIIIGFAPGGGTDIQARQVAPTLAEVLGVSVIVENRPGASTMLAAQEVARATPDGHTILYSFSGAMAQNPHTLLSVPYDIIGWLADFGPAGMRPELGQRLNAALPQAVAHPEVKEGFARGIYEAVSSTPAELAGIVKDSYERWGALVRRVGIKPN